MTTQKSLKARVRERMARTGESYTTAHRHVTAHAPDRHPPVHQPSFLVRHLLGAAGLDVSEPTACGLGGGIGFLYSVFDYQQVDHPLLTIVAQHHPTPWLTAVAENLGIALTTAHSSSPTAARTKLDRALDDGVPVLLTVARGLLPHHEAASELEAADPYQVVVAGRRDDSYVVEDLGPEPHLVEATDLVAAWSAHRKGRFEMTQLADDDARTVDLAHGVRRALRMTHDHLTGPVLGNSFDVNFGLSGMRKLARELQDVSTKAGWVRRFDTTLRAVYACDRLADCLTHDHTAPGATRPLYARFLSQAADLLDESSLVRAAELVATSGEGWTALAAEAKEHARAGVPDPGRAFAGFARTVERCADLEEEAVGELVRPSSSASR